MTRTRHLSFLSPCAEGMLLNVLFVCFIGSLASSCPTHVQKVAHSYTATHNHVCYLFVNTEVYWGKAKDRCFDLGGEMLSIEDPETMDFIKKKLNSPELSWDRQGVWLGASKSRGRWHWTNGRVMNYTNWAPGQPSNILGILSVEDCSQMRYEDGWKWHDILCGSLNFHYNFICQFALSRPGDVVGRVSSSAAHQTEDNGNASLLAIIVGIGTGILIIAGVIFLVLHLTYRKRRQKADAMTVHYTNSYLEPSNGIAHYATNAYSSPPGGPIYYTSQVIQAPTQASQQELYSSRDPLYAESQSISSDKTRRQKVNQTAEKCNCRSRLARDTSLCSSPGTESELGACGGSDPELECQVPLMAEATQECQVTSGCQLEDESTYACCCTLKQADYMTMNSGVPQKMSEVIVEEEKHTYSNVDYKESSPENLYEVLP